MVERWLSGPIAGIDPLLMPAAHALLQARDDISRLISGLTRDQLWQRVGDSASIGFHALHLAGATARLMTYARGEPLTDSQAASAQDEKTITGLEASDVIARVEAAIDAAIEQIRTTSPSSLEDARAVGRQRLPSTVIGVIFHAAEHAARHAGQIATLRRIIAR